MSKKGARYFQHNAEFKLRVVEEYLSGSFGPSFLCKKYAIHESTLYRWIHTFAPEHKFNPVIMARQKDPESAKILELKKALRQKAVELQREKMRADFYETMIDVAEEQFHISIRKKAGTKQ